MHLTTPCSVQGQLNERLQRAYAQLRKRLQHAPALHAPALRAAAHAAAHAGHSTASGQGVLSWPLKDELWLS